MNLYKKTLQLFNIKKETNLVERTFTDFNKSVKKQTQQRLGSHQYNIKFYRNALSSAESVHYPSRENLNNIYRDCILDSDIYALIQLRKSASLNKKYILTDEQNNIVTDYNKELYRKMIDIILDSIFEGFKIFKFDDIVDNKITEIEKIDNNYVNITKHIFVSSQSEQKGIDYTVDELKNWFVEIFKDRNDLGLLNAISQYYIQKQNIQSSMSTFAEISGSPYRIVKTNATDEKTVDDIATSLASMRSNGWGIFSQQDILEFIDTQNGNKGEVYINILKYFNDAISKVLVGGTNLISSLDSASLASATIHENNFKRIVSSDLSYIENTLNNNILEKISILTNTPKLTFKFDTTEEQTTSEQFKIDIELIKAGLTLDIDYLNEKYNTKIISNAKSSIQ